MTKIHARKFSGQSCTETMGGPVVTEDYVPLCGSTEDDPEFLLERREFAECTEENDFEGITCGRCLNALKP